MSGCEESTCVSSDDPDQFLAGLGAVELHQRDPLGPERLPDCQRNALTRPHHGFIRYPEYVAAPAAESPGLGQHLLVGRARRNAPFDSRHGGSP